MSQNGGVQVSPGVPPESAPLIPADAEFLERLQLEFASEPIESQTLIRFVRGYCKEKTRWETTVQKLRETLEWRKENNVDNILAAPLPDEEKYFGMYPHAIHGVSKNGHPVYYENPCAIEPALLLETFTVEQQLQFHIQMMELLQKVKRELEKMSGHRTYKQLVVMDLSGMSTQHAGSKFRGPMQAQINIDQYYYPESLQTLYIINAPFVFRMLWSVVKPWLHPLTAARIQILGKDYITSLKEVIDEDQIPKYYGGSCTCCPEGKEIKLCTGDIYEKFVIQRDEIMNRPVPDSTLAENNDVVVGKEGNEL